MISKEEAYKKIASLIERFDEQKEFYKRSDYNETLTRRDFIDPFFKALGWDIDNEQGYAESYREVIHEDKIKIGKATKAPDYSFRLGGGKRLFFVEAKKPSVLIKDEITPAYQVRRYGWSAKLAISLITDFEEFAIYDCTKKPNLTDKASHARIKYFTYQQYLNEFDFIWDTLSKEKVLKGSFDKFVAGNKQKKGTTTVDHEFLISLDTWRTYLATNIALRNNIDEDELNFVVQHIIDRLIFLRIAEDRVSYNKANYRDEEIIKQIDKLKKKLEAIRPLPIEQIKNLEEYFRIQYTYDSNRIEGNTLTLQETALVINHGITISGKSVNEHLEAINHSEAVELILDLVQNKIHLTEYILKQLHGLILRGINKYDAGKYRNVNVMISGSTHKPPEPFMLDKLMEEYFLFYEANKNTMHPVLLAAEMHERLVTIHPFVDGNGRTSRLIMNLILMQHGFPITHINGDKQNRFSYYKSLESVRVNNDKNAFYDFVANATLSSLTEFLSIVIPKKG